MTDAPQTAPGTTFIPLKQPQDHLPPRAATPAPSPAPPSRPTSIIDIPDDSEPITVRLVGITYEVTLPKALVAMRLSEQMSATDFADPDAALGKLGEFVRMIFGPEGPGVMARLEDPDDHMDVRHVLRLIERLTEVAGGVPPTLPPGSPESSLPTTSTSTGTPSLTGSPT